MDWNERYPKGKAPNMEQISTYIKSPLWDDLCQHLESTYKVRSIIEHSSCSMIPGYNVKYRKSGKSLCTLYPEEGFFYCLVVVGKKEEAEVLLPELTPETQNLYQEAKPYNGARWLTLKVINEQTLEDIKALISLRVATK